jgi:hypothetical protein
MINVVIAREPSRCAQDKLRDRGNLMDRYIKGAEVTRRLRQGLPRPDSIGARNDISVRSAG